jgi:hypothetical protein
MDEWTKEEVLSMLEGGNAQLNGFFQRHALTEDSVAVQSCASSVVPPQQKEQHHSNTTNKISSPTTSKRVSPTTSGLTRENVTRLRYKTKAALFYRRQMEIHIANIVKVGPYRGREISRSLKHHSLESRNSTVD